MTLRELYSIPHLEKEIKDYEDKILQLEEQAESITAKITGLPSGGRVSDKVGEGATGIVYYKAILRQAISKRLADEIAIFEYIQNVQDAEMRRIMYLRFIQQKKWREVADDVGGNNTEDSVRKRCNRYVEKHVETSDMSVNKAI